MAYTDPDAGDALSKRISQMSHRGSVKQAKATTPQEPILIDWPEGDPENPFNWSKARKWRSIGLAFAFTITSAYAATAYVAGFPSMLEELNTTELHALTANAALFIVAAICPILLAPLSEQFGRRSLMLASNVLQTLLYLPQGLAPNVETIIGVRAIQGVAGSAGNSLVGGFVADVFNAQERGFPMSIFTLSVFCSTAFGGIAFSWINVAIGWRWIQWLSMIISGALAIASFFLLEETRGSKILAARAIRLTEETGLLHVPRSAQSSVLPVKTQIAMAATRAIKLLFTEPIVLFYSLYISLLWGEIFLFFNSVPYVFAQYGFSDGEIGLVFVANVVGSVAGSILCHFGDKLYQRDRRRSAHDRAPPESRLYPCLLGALLTPAAYYMFAWTGQPHIHWMAPTVALALFNFGVFPIYFAAFSYMADTYEIYASSAVAAQSCLRNIMGGCLPLAAPAIYGHLSYPVAGTVLASMSAFFAPVPFVLFFFGARIRSWSKVATHIGHLEIAEEVEVHHEKDVERASSRTATSDAVAPAKLQ